MSGKILTFGYDACHRWAVLRLAGFTVHVCESVSELRDQLLKRTAIDAVVMVEDIVSVPQDAIATAEAYFNGPLVLFEARAHVENRNRFNLCIPILSGPSVWLPQLEALVESHPKAPAAGLGIEEKANSR